MISGTLIRLPNTVVLDQIGRCRWEREDRAFDLKNLIQFTPQRLNIGQPARVGLVVAQKVGIEKSLTIAGDGSYQPETVEVVKTDWCYSYFAPPIAVVDRIDNSYMLRETLEKGLRLPRASVRSIFLDTHRMRTDHPDQWVRGFGDRAGNVERGRVYGHAVEQDVAFEAALRTSKDKEAGWETSAFGSISKVKASTNGSVTILGNPTPDQFLRFILREILPYEIAAPI